MSKLKVFYGTPSATDPLSFYRGTDPLYRLEQQYEDIEIVYDDEFNRRHCCQCDIVFLQRPYNESHLRIVEICNEEQIPVICDFDDWFIDLPKGNPACGEFLMNKQNFINILIKCDAFTATTVHLLNLLKKIAPNKPGLVVPNAYDHLKFCHYRHDQNIKERNKYIIWRGGNSHTEDLLSVKHDYEKLFIEYPDWDFIFIAQHPFMLDVGPNNNVKVADGMKHIKYFEALHNNAPAIMCHPLTDCDFNRSKSMCSWLEATHARAAFVGPDFEEFKRPGVTNYNKDFSFYDAVTSLIENPKKVGENIMASNDYMMKNLTLTKVNEIRHEFYWKIFESYDQSRMKNIM